MRFHRAQTAFFLLAGPLLATVACDRTPATQPGGSSPAGPRIKLGFIVKQPEEPWFQMEWKFADQAAAQFGFDLVKIGAADGEKVLAAIDSLAAGGAKGFVICTPDVRLGPAIVNRAAQHQLKMITVDDQFVGPDGKFMNAVPYLGISARKIGEAVGAALLEEVRARRWSVDETAVCVVTYDELDTARERTDGAIEALRAGAFPADRIFRAAVRTTDIPGSFDAANTLLTQHADVIRWLVCGMNDNAVLGAVRALEGRGLKAEQVIGIGINGTDCIDELRKPTPTGFFASILLTPRRHGFETVEMLFRWVRDGAAPPPDTRTTGILIHRGNFESVLREQGIIG